MRQQGIRGAVSEAAQLPRTVAEMIDELAFSAPLRGPQRGTDFRRKPRIEALETRALLSALPCTIHHVVPTPHLPAIIFRAGSANDANPKLVSPHLSHTHHVGAWRSGRTCDTPSQSSGMPVAQPEYSSPSEHFPDRAEAQRRFMCSKSKAIKRKPFSPCRTGRARASRSCSNRT